MVALTRDRDRIRDLVLDPDHPRPQLQRAGWASLDGLWDFAFDPAECWRAPDEVAWDREIRVPFAPETPLSGINDQGFHHNVWYRRQFDAPPLAPGERLILRFGAVDFCATVWVNGTFAGRHEGGYTPFGLDVSRCLNDEGPQTVAVLAEDDPFDLAKPRGKQDWQRNPHAIWYPRTTGIWQTVWLECLPASWIETIRWTPSLDRWDIGLEVLLAGERGDDLRLEVELASGNGSRLEADPAGSDGARRRLLARDVYGVVAGEVHRRIALSDPGIDDFRNELLWSPTSPTLIDARFRLLDAAGTIVDEVVSYTALRAVGTQGDRFVLNGRPFFLRLVLDQGYWPESGLTPPSTQALKRDVELAKAMGFNGVRKHQKLEDPRYLYWADRLGLLVWGEMPSAYRFTTRSVDRLTSEWKDALLRDLSHPCLVAWVPINESWGVPDLPSSPAQRDYIQALYHLTKTIDPSRPVVGNDGWESAATDIVGIHDYDDDPAKLAQRYGAADGIPHLFRRERPAGRLLTLEGHEHAGQPLVLSEFGGIAWTFREERARTWGYVRADTPAELAERYRALLEVVNASALLAGFCYTQFADTYQECNGLLTGDRTPKFPLEEIERATRGPRGRRALEQERSRRRVRQRRLDGLDDQDDGAPPAAPAGELARDDG